MIILWVLAMTGWCWLFFTGLHRRWERQAAAIDKQEMQSTIDGLGASVDALTKQREVTEAAHQLDAFDVDEKLTKAYHLCQVILADTKRLTGRGRVRIRRSIVPEARALFSLLMHWP